MKKKDIIAKCLATVNKLVKADGILNIGITTNKKKGMPIIKVYIRYIRTLLSVINIRISYQYIIVKQFDFIY